MSIGVRGARAMRRYSGRGTVCRTRVLVLSLESDQCHHAIDGIRKVTKKRAAERDVMDATRVDTATVLDEDDPAKVFVLALEELVIEEVVAER